MVLEKCTQGSGEVRPCVSRMGCIAYQGESWRGLESNACHGGRLRNLRGPLLDTLHGILRGGAGAHGGFASHMIRWIENVIAYHRQKGEMTT